jgi:hypothetical protein
MSEANYKYQGLSILRKVYNLATTATAGYGVVYDHTSTTKAAVTVQDLARGKYVNTPSVTKNKYFAGVSTGARSDAGVIEVACPGSDCLIYVGETSATAGQIVYCDCGDNAGKFYLGGSGRTNGSAILLETVDAVGLYHAKLCEGPEEGLLQMLTPVLAGAAIVLTAEGMTLINGGTVDTADLTSTLADGTVNGQKKSVKITTTIGNTKDFTWTITSGEKFDGTTDISTLVFNTAAEETHLEWKAIAWQLVGSAGTTIT